MRTHPISWIPLILLLVAAPLVAQAVHPGKRVRLRAPAFLLDRFEGVFIGRSGDTLAFGNDDRGPLLLPSSAITQLDVSGGTSRLRGSLRGALWGGAVLVAIGGLASSDTIFNTEGVPTGQTFDILDGAVIGALLGAIIGAFVPARVWRAAEPRILLNAPSAPIGVGVGVSLAVPVSRERAFPNEGDTPAVEFTVGSNVSGPKFPGAQFPDMAVSLAVNRASKPTRGAALVAEFDVIANSGRGLMAGPRVYARNGPLFAGRTTVTYFGQILAGAVLSEESGVVRSRGGFGTQPGAGIDFGVGARALRLQYDHRIVPGGVVEDSRRSPPEIARLSGPRFVVGYTQRFLSR